MKFYLDQHYKMIGILIIMISANYGHGQSSSFNVINDLNQGDKFAWELTINTDYPTKVGNIYQLTIIKSINKSPDVVDNIAGFPEDYFNTTLNNKKSSDFRPKDVTNHIFLLLIHDDSTPFIEGTSNTSTIVSNSYIKGDYYYSKSNLTINNNTTSFTDVQYNIKTGIMIYYHSILDPIEIEYKLMRSTNTDSSSTPLINDQTSSTTTENKSNKLAVPFNALFTIIIVLGLIPMLRKYLQIKY